MSRGLVCLMFLLGRALLGQRTHITPVSTILAPIEMRRDVALQSCRV